MSLHLRLRRALVSVLAGAVVSVGHAEALDRILLTGKVVLAHRTASVPFSYVVDGRPVGYSVDVCLKIVEAIRRQTQVRSLRVDYKEIVPATRFSSIENGEADLECAGATDNVERRGRVTFTYPHFIAAGRLMVRAGDAYERLEDLDGHRVASTSNSSNLKSLAAEAHRKSIELDIRAAKDHAEAVQWLLAGQVDAFAMDDVLLFSLRARAAHPQALKIIGKSMTVEPYAVFFQHDSPRLKAIVDAELLRLMRSGELEALYAKWFQSPVPPDGLNLNMPMSPLLVDTIRRPVDFILPEVGTRP